MIRSVATALSWLMALAMASATNAQETPPQRYALLIGIDGYYAPGVAKLNYAARDAETLADRLRRQGYQVTRLSNTEATRDAIVGQLMLMQETLRKDDAFVLYYAGHGLLREFNRQVYWLNYQGDPRRPDLEGLRLRHVIELVSEIPAARKLVLLDHCYSGANASSLGGGSGFERDAAGGNATASNPATAAPAVSREAIPAQLLDDIDAGATAGQAQGQATFVVAASRGAALEFTQEQHGIFTFVLLRAFAEDKADTVRDGGLSITELNDFLTTEVDLLSRSKGFEQETLTRMVQTVDPKTLKWQPFFRSLSQSEIDAKQAEYRDRLQEWASKGLLTARVRNLAEQLLLKWKSVSPPASLDERDEKAIAYIRLVLENVRLPEEIAVAEFSKRVSYWGEP